MVSPIKFGNPITACRNCIKSRSGKQWAQLFTAYAITYIIWGCFMAIFCAIMTSLLPARPGLGEDDYDPVNNPNRLGWPRFTTVNQPAISWTGKAGDITENSGVDAKIEGDNAQINCASFPCTFTQQIKINNRQGGFFGNRVQQSLDSGSESEQQQILGRQADRTYTITCTAIEGAENDITITAVTGGEFADGTYQGKDTLDITTNNNAADEFTVTFAENTFFPYLGRVTFEAQAAGNTKYECRISPTDNFGVDNIDFEFKFVQA
eukprot:Clim_evm13s212 gene=Clim_evmTU13s212